MELAFSKTAQFVHDGHDLAGTGYAGGPYSVHLKQVDAQLVAWCGMPNIGLDPRVIMLVRFGGLLHDFFEDIALAPETWPQMIASLQTRFEVPLPGIDMALLCTDPADPGLSRKERKAIAFRRIAQCYGAILIKLADRTGHLNASHGPESHGYLSMYLDEHDGFRDAFRRVDKARYMMLKPVYEHAYGDYLDAITLARGTYAKGPQ